MDELTEVRIARNDATFRSANEKIARTAAHSELTQKRVPFICECAARDCTEIIQLSLDEYESVRADPRHFFNAPGHQAADEGAARVVGYAENYVIVEKLGHAGEVAERLDERDQSYPEQRGASE